MDRIYKIISKLIIIIISVITLSIIYNFNEVKAFSMGVLDIEGGKGIPRQPYTYFPMFDNGDLINFCVDNELPLQRTRDGTLGGQAMPYVNRNDKEYFNQNIEYEYAPHDPNNKNQAMEAEQSIVAAIKALNEAENRNGVNVALRKEAQVVVWSSGQWSGGGRKKTSSIAPNYRLASNGNVSLNYKWKNNYVNNLYRYNSYYSFGTGKVVSRGEAWANFYYKVLSESDMKLNISVSQAPTNMMINQVDRTCSQGPYRIELMDANNGIITNNTTEHYEPACSLGTLVYNEITGQNAGTDLFQFCYLNSATAEITYEDGTIDSNVPIEVIDSAGNVLKFPRFGEDFYVRIKIPSNESRIIKKFDIDFDVGYWTKIEGTAKMYKAKQIYFELSNAMLQDWTDSYLLLDDGNKSQWLTNQTIEELSVGGVKTAENLENHLINIIIDNAAKEGFKPGLKLYPTATFEARIQGTSFTSLDEFKNFLIETKKGEEINKIAYSRTIYWYKGISYATYEEAVKAVEKDKGDISNITSTDYYNYNNQEYDSYEAAKNAAESVGEQNGIDLYNKKIKQSKWSYNWCGLNPIFYDAEWQYPESDTEHVQPVIEVEPGKPKTSSTSFHLMGEEINIVIGGKVWVDEPATKETKLNGRLNANDSDTADYRYAGMLVDLYLGGNIVASTTTDQNGSYRFEHLNPLEKYVVKFTYNGQIYEDTYYKEDLSGGFSNAKDVDRENFNKRFEKIDSSPNNYNYNGWHQAYALETKLKKDNGEFIPFEDRALTYQDSWNKFVEFAKNDKSYTQAYTDLTNWLTNLGVGATDKNGVVQYIKDCMIVAEVRKLPDFDYFVVKDLNNPQNQPATVTVMGRTWNSLYTSSSDQSRNVDFGIYVRDTADLAIQKDVYKATVRVNGKTQEYIYNKKDANIDDDGAWNITVRAGDYLYNGNYKYNREIRKSEYIYDGSIYGANGGTDAKDLQVYVTYRIAVRNQSQSYDTVVNEIVDYYDKNEYEYIENNSIIKANTYVGNRSAEKIADLTVTTGSTLNNNRGNTTLTNYYEPLYLSGIKVKDENGNITDRIPSGGGMAYIYLTFKVKTHTDENGMDGKPQMDVDVNTGLPKGVGKRNLAEINGYSTYYKENRNNNPALIPDKLENDNTPKDKDVSGNVAGLVDKDSNVGNLSSQDLNNNGDLIITDNPLTNRTEDDTDKAPNIKLVFPENDNEERTFTGYVYEDERNQASDKAVVGDGRWNEGETKINGLTVQLVETVQEVNSDGSPTGNYLGEYVWYARKYENGNWVDVNSSANSGSQRYYSGQGNYETDHKVAPIISGPEGTATFIDGYTFPDDSTGQYAFKGVPAGDYFIRFIYGDTTQTVLTMPNGQGKEVVDLLNSNGITAEVDGEKGFISTNGLNDKSYNGQDYKSTTYQVGVNQNTSYNGINGFTDYNKQNYNITTPNNKTSDYAWRRQSDIDGKDKSIMYYYDIGESQTQSGISDAKDVKNIRDNATNYAKGISGVDTEDHQTLQNNRNEVLASGIKVGTKKDPNEQVNLIKELTDNTAGVAQTGIINTEIEYNRTRTEGQGDSNEMYYLVEDIDLGLEERPVAQLKMFKEVSNLKITLADGTIMFDTGKTVTNLPFAKHEGHKIEYDETYNPAYRLKNVYVGPNTESTPELITTYMDEELMYGARIELTYKFIVSNVGEVDYLDNQFYYTGKTNNTNVENISKTTADTVIDYVSNNLQFLPTNSNNTDWSIRTVGELIKSDNNGTLAGDDTDLINSKYEPILNTYNAIVTTKALGSEPLLPEKVGEGTPQLETKMMLSSTLTPDSGDDSMVYNNLCEIVQVSNDQGRRLKYSIVGNQPMADQSKGTGDPSNPAEGIYTKADLVTPTEIDADSSQQVLILPPTGANKNYTLWAIIGLAIAILIGGSVFLIRKKVLKK